MFRCFTGERSGHSPKCGKFRLHRCSSLRLRFFGHLAPTAP